MSLVQVERCKTHCAASCFFSSGFRVRHNICRSVRRNTVCKFSNQNKLTNVDTSSRISLSKLREQLIHQEDAIIFHFISRIEFLHNEAVYAKGELTADSSQSLLEMLLKDTEHIHGRIRRYTSPDENSFFPHLLPKPILPPLQYPEVLAPYSPQINVNDEIFALYLNTIPRITKPGCDNNYGSTAMIDVISLQEISKRIHYGKFVAEAKFQSNRGLYTELIKEKNFDAILDNLTTKSVEEQVIKRVEYKTSIFAQNLNKMQTSQVDLKVDPKVVAGLFRDQIIPLTKKVEIKYLERRLEWMDDQQGD